MKQYFLISSIIICIMLSACGGEPYTNEDYTAFLALLNENGFQYTEGELDFEHGFLSVARKPLLLEDGQLISVYVYKTNEAMENDSTNICKYGFAISRKEGDQLLQTQISWVSIPHFFKGGTLIINYVGEDERILNFLTENYGVAFAGGPFLQAEEESPVVSNIDWDNIYSYPEWQNIPGFFTSKDEVQNVSFYSTISDDFTGYIMKIETSTETLIANFAEGNIQRIEKIYISDLTGDGLDEIVVILSHSRAAPLYILTACQDEPRLLFSISYNNLSPHQYPLDFGFSGVMNPDLEAVFTNRYISSEAKMDLNRFINEICLYDENTIFETDLFEFEFAFIAVPDEYRDISLGFRINDGSNGKAEIVCSGTVALRYSHDDVYINEYFAEIHVYLEYDGDIEFVIMGYEIKPL